MYLSRLFIRNFRSIKQLDLSFYPGKNILVGRNNAGKSNIIKAINLVLGENSPAYKKSENLTADDFFSSSEFCADSIIIWCELTRRQNEALDYENLYGSCSGYHVSVDPNFQPLRYHVDSECEVLPSLFEIPKEGKNNKWVNATDIAKGELNQVLEPMHLFAYAFVATFHNGNIEKSLRLFYRENDTKDWVMSFYSPFRNEFIQSALIPSFRDPQNQLRINAWTWYGKLLKSVTANSEHEEELRDAMEKVRTASNKIFSDVEKKVTSSSIYTTFPGTSIHFQFNTETKSDLYKSCVIYIDDGFKSQLSEKGSGIQSAVIVGLFSYYMREVNTIGSALLCIEEPELFLHPHGRRVMNSNLDLFLDDDRNQIILSTHSPEFINTPSDANLILVRKLYGETNVSNISTKKFKNILLDNEQNELFFADKVIVCEGYDNYILRWVAEECFPGKLDEQNISIIKVCGKDNFSKIIKHLLDLKIECYLLADFDYLLRDKDKQRKQYSTLAHESVINLPLSFFEQISAFGDRGNKTISKISKWRNALKLTNPKIFYNGKSVNEIPDGDLKIKLSELLEDLRSHGICILSGEIENLFFSSTKLKNGKLTLDNIYELKTQLDSGSKLSELIDITQIKTFLYHVLDQSADYNENEMYSEESCTINFAEDDNASGFIDELLPPDDSNNTDDPFDWDGYIPPDCDEEDSLDWHEDEQQDSDNDIPF